jgi:hypothetical protein
VSFIVIQFTVDALFRSKRGELMAKNSNSAKPANIGEPVITDEVRKVAELTPDPHNARRHSETQISQIAQPGHKGALKASSFKERIGIATVSRIWLPKLRIGLG